MKYPRVLVVSNNSFSKTGSNGRTLGNYFLGWPKENLAQFCISTDTPDYDVCNNYYLVTDKSAYDGFIHLRKAKRCDIEMNYNSKGNFQIAQKKYYKSPAKTIIRNVIWWPKRWKSKEFISWVDGFNPDIILLMNSDSVFVLRIALDLTKDKRIPIVMFNTEGFYFFKRPYMYSKKWELGLFSIYQKYYRHVFSRIMDKVDFTIYANDKLQGDYTKVFGGKSIVLYTGSTLCPTNTAFNTEHPVFSYIGNLAYSRIDALIEVGEVLQTINPSYVLNVFGKFNNTIANKVEDHKGICLKGFITYDQVLDTIRNSDVLFHAETQDKKWAEALEYGFSTKIADSISSGKSFVLYSSPDIAGADYIIKTGAGWFASNKEELKNAIVTIINDEVKRKSVLSRAKQIALENHQTKANCVIFQQLLSSIIKP